MNKFKKGFLTLALLAFLTLGVFALDNDYKNNLLKVDVSKIGADRYQINLFTQKPYNTPVRVIKKSDTSYYILLPETYHSITSTSATDDIKNVEVKLYPYAGQDLNNGYTKINITTAKAVAFSTGLKTASGAQAPKVDFDKLAKMDKVFAGNPTPKPVATPSKPVEKPVVKPVEKPQYTPKPVVKEKPVVVAPPRVEPVVKEQPKAEAPVVKQPKAQPIQIQIPKRETTEKMAIAQKTEPVKQLTKAAGQIKSATDSKVVVIDVDPDAKKPAGPTKHLVDVQNVKVSEDGPPQDIMSPDELDDAIADKQVDGMQPIDENGNLVAQEELQGVSDVAVLDNGPKGVLAKVKSVLRTPYNLMLDNLAAFVAIAALIFVLLLVMLGSKRKKKTRTPVGLQPQAEVMRSEPATAQVVAPVMPDTPVFMEVGPQEDEPMYSAPQVEEEPIYVPPTPQYQPQMEVSQEYSPEPVNEDEAQVLSFVEIEPGRGFYLARFEGAVSLIGYSGDDLSVIHTFDYEPQDTRIMHRLSEKSSEGTFYLVKVDTVKMLVRSTEHSLTLELLM